MQHLLCGLWLHLPLPLQRASLSNLQSAFHVHTGVPSPDFLFPASLSQPGCCLALGRKTHTLLEAQIKGSTPLPASQWTLCAEGSQRELGSKETGRGGGALHKDTCHSEKPSEDGVKKAPGGGWRLAAGMQMDSPCLWSLWVSQARETTVVWRVSASIYSPALSEVL